METMWDLVQALKNCDGETGNAEDNLSDVEASARDAADSAEAATERIRDIQSVLSDAIELAEKLQGEKDDEVISKEDVKQFLIATLADLNTSYTDLKPRFNYYANEFSIKLEE